MATIKDLKTSVSELSEEELFARIRELRGQRRKETPRTAKRKAKAAEKRGVKKPKTKNLKSLAAMMSAKERLELLKMLEES